MRDRQHLRGSAWWLGKASGLGARDGEVLQGPYLLARGLMADDLPALLTQAENAVHSALSEWNAHGQAPDWDQACDQITTTLKRFFKKKLQARPGDCAGGG